MLIPSMLRKDTEVKVLRMQISLKWVLSPTLRYCLTMLAQVEDTFFLDESQTTEANNIDDSLSFLQAHT